MRSEGKKLLLETNEVKVKYTKMTVAESRRHAEDFDVGGTRIEGVRAFKNLEPVVNSENKIHEEMSNRLATEVMVQRN